ncbi:MAG: TIGR00282 family metallophosphoesterase [Solobacterium sp.]|nr:TIGR00282 family metallophosphoesterase [Solobacterium sp.]
MKILFLGDVVSRSGRIAVKRRLADLKQEVGANFTVINGENAAHGKGITSSIYNELMEAGADVITLGNHSFSKHEILGKLNECPYLVRPANMDPEEPGNCVVIRECQGKRIAVVNILGGVFMNNALGESYPVGERLLNSIDADIILVDFHGEATGEKELFWYLYRDRITAMVGTHTHVQTADERIAHGSAYISDVGMCGSFDSILGRDVDEMIARTHGKATRYTPAETPAILCGVVIEIDDATNRAIRITRIQERP